MELVSLTGKESARDLPEAFFKCLRLYQHSWSYGPTVCGLRRKQTVLA